jgi:hypothetical protein
VAALGCALGCALAVTPAFGADDGDAPKADDTVTSEDCRPAPDADGDQPSDEAGAADEATLSDKLDRCGGVLAPPESGDAEITEPAPDTGETPVIPPGQVPEQAPKK